MKKLILLFALTVFSLQFSGAQDIRGGEIRIQYITGLQYRFDVYLYTQTSLAMDHSVIAFNNGFGTGALTGISTNLLDDFTEWHYVDTVTYPGNGVYDIYAADSFRVASIQNINNSSTEGILLSAILQINANIGSNSSPVLMSSQSTVNFSGGYFTHNPMASDPDGDTLHFSLVPTSSVSYSSPPGITIDSVTGIVQMPDAPGIYAINIRIDQLRTIPSVPAFS
jgi:hypothetical protein